MSSLPWVCDEYLGRNIFQISHVAQVVGCEQGRVLVSQASFAKGPKA